MYCFDHIVVHSSLFWNAANCLYFSQKIVISSKHMYFNLIQYGPCLYIFSIKDLIIELQLTFISDNYILFFLLELSKYFGCSYSQLAILAISPHVWPCIVQGEMRLSEWVCVVIVSRAPCGLPCRRLETGTRRAVTSPIHQSCHHRHVLINAHGHAHLASSLVRLCRARAVLLQICNKLHLWAIDLKNKKTRFLESLMFMLRILRCFMYQSYPLKL